MKKIFLLLLITSFGLHAAAKKEEKNVLRLGQLGLTEKAYIGGVRGVGSDIDDAIPVLISSDGQLVTMSGKY